MERGRIENKMVENNTSRQVTFCKCCNGFLKKAYELSAVLGYPVVTLIVAVFSCSCLYE